MKTGLGEAIVTVYKFCKTSKEYPEFIPNHLPLTKALERIRNSKHKSEIQAIRDEPLQEKRREMKADLLPAIVFSGKIDKGRKDVGISVHSGLAILDFDHLDAEKWHLKRDTLTKLPFVVSVFKSPSGDGIKALVRILDGSKHRLHYAALMKEFTDADPKNVNPSRVCFESYDPDIYINLDAQPYTKILEVTTEAKVVPINRAPITENEYFNKLEKWLQNKREAYETGNKHHYLFLLASACCRFGIEKSETINLIKEKYLSRDGHCKIEEADKITNSAYGNSFNRFGSCEFSNDIFVEKKTKIETVIDLADSNIVDVIFGKDVFEDAIRLFDYGYESAERTGIAELDELFKWKRGELTILTGIGNHGKSTMLKFMMLNKAVKDGSKWAIFGPEDYPAHEFYHDIVEMLIGANCTPSNPEQPPRGVYERAYEFVSQHFFYIYPKTQHPTPDYIKTRFVELIIKFKVDGCVIDPYNQMFNDYNSAGGRDDKYLDSFLTDCNRFALTNHIFFVIVAHPHKLKKNENKGYDCPDIYDLAGGAMWNNKADNILVYHRPNRHKDADDTGCELHTKKIRRQKIVGKIGVAEFIYSRGKRRFIFEDYPIKKSDFGAIEPPTRAPLNETKRNSVQPKLYYGEIDDDSKPF